VDIMSVWYSDHTARTALGLLLHMQLPISFAKSQPDFAQFLASLSEIA